MQMPSNDVDDVIKKLLDKQTNIRKAAVNKGILQRQSTLGSRALRSSVKNSEIHSPNPY